MADNSFVQQCVDSLADKFMHEYHTSALLTDGYERAFELWVKILGIDQVIAKHVWGSVYSRYLRGRA